MTEKISWRKRRNEEKPDGQSQVQRDHRKVATFPQGAWRVHSRPSSPRTRTQANQATSQVERQALRELLVALYVAHADTMNARLISQRYESFTILRVE